MPTLKEARETPYAWPGGYPIYAVLDDGEALCAKCIQLPEVHEGGDSDGWRYEGAQVYWEGPDMNCAHCSAALPSAYGDPEEED